MDVKPGDIIYNPHTNIIWIIQSIVSKKENITIAIAKFFYINVKNYHLHFEREGIADKLHLSEDGFKNGYIINLGNSSLIRLLYEN